MKQDDLEQLLFLNQDSQSEGVTRLEAIYRNYLLKIY